jgi:hypothetical protein
VGDQPDTARRGSGPITAVAALLAWAALIAVAHVLGTDVVHRLPKARIVAAPLVARFDVRVTPALLIPLGAGALAVLFAWRLAARLTWRRLLLLAFVAAGAWAVALASIDGLHELIRPLLGPSDYLTDVPLVGSPGGFLRHFVERIASYHQHVQGHPPGMVLVLWSLDAAGLRGPAWEAALDVVGGAATVPAAMIALREVAGERQARAAAPFLAFAPVAVWIATSGDALIAGVGAWSIASVVVAIRRSGVRSDLPALAGGLLFGATLMLSYGAVLLAAIPLLVAIRFHRARPLVLWTVGAAAVLLAFTAAGFWWPAGLRATTRRYRLGVARFRPQSYFWYGNLAAFAIAVGPATAVGLARLRDPATWLLVAGALVAVAVADATGLSKAEVERIWLPFATWVLLAGSSLAGDLRAAAAGAAEPRAWLAVTAGTGLAIQVLLLTTW